MLVVSWGSPVLAPTEVLRNQTKFLPTTTLVAVGDIMFSRHVGTKINEAGNPNLPFLKVADILSGADITFGNLECPLSDSNVPIREGIVFRCLTQHAAGIKQAGFDALSTANNHSMDQGADNVDFTIEHLNSLAIAPVGTSKVNESSKSAVIERNGIRFGFLAYSYTAHNDGGKSTHPQIATMDISQMNEDIADLKNKSDAIIASMHAGTEYTRKPNQGQIDFAHAAIDAGADIVIGHHPHWIQEIEIYQGKPIFYSLGNFVFDQMWSQDTREGLAVKLEFQASKLKSAELIPVVIDNYCCPRPATEKEKISILSKIKAKSYIKF